MDSACGKAGFGAWHTVGAQYESVAEGVGLQVSRI